MPQNNLGAITGFETNTQDLDFYGLLFAPVATRNSYLKYFLFRCILKSIGHKTTCILQKDTISKNLNLPHKKVTRNGYHFRMEVV